MLTTGAFAELCGTKKGTLLFYDKEGLLKPKCISENGYRHYSVSFHSKCKVWEQRPDTVRQFKEPCQCGVPRIFQGAA